MQSSELETIFNSEWKQRVGIEFFDVLLCELRIYFQQNLTPQKDKAWWFYFTSHFILIPVCCCAVFWYIFTDSNLCLFKEGHCYFLSINCSHSNLFKCNSWIATPMDRAVKKNLLFLYLLLLMSCMAPYVVWQHFSVWKGFFFPFLDFLWVCLVYILDFSSTPYITRAASHILEFILPLASPPSNLLLPAVGTSHWN